MKRNKGKPSHIPESLLILSVSSDGTRPFLHYLINVKSKPLTKTKLTPTTALSQLDPIDTVRKSELE